MGVEVDEWGKPVAYWLYPRHSGDNMVNGVPPSNEYQRVPAEEVIHLALFDRPGQTRGVPWFHAAMTKLRHMGGYEEAEIVRARASASIMGFIQSPEVDGVPGIGEDPMGSDAIVDGEKVFDMSPGIIKELAPGETFEGFNPSSANAAMEPFMRFMLRSVAAGVGVSYESLSRDYSQSNYSSSRLALLDDRDNWKVLQQWLMEALHQEVFDAWLGCAVLSSVLPLPSYEASPEIYEAVRWMPRGWDWVDPLKEVTAARMSVRSGFQSIQDVVSAKGGDFEDVFTQRAREVAMAADLGLVQDTDPAIVNDKGQAQILGGQVAPDEGEVAAGEDNTGAATDENGTSEGGATSPAASKIQRRALLEEEEHRLVVELARVSDELDALTN
jgi:lambda family phage portal protein